MTLPLIADALVALLLIATIAYVLRLNARLGVLREDKAKLEELIRGLTAASESARAGIAGLKNAAEDIGKDLQKRTAAGHSLRDDLTYLIERGGSVADRLEGTIRARREQPAQAASEERPAEPRPAASEKVTALRLDPEADAPARRSGQISRAERNLLRALGARR
ncbi:MAG TPA: DUF6468 domain-containing protein [Stellaceae bacterium]|nr:DUF6468 domain-containing protein [Stellaceae bacterium]